MSVMPHYEIVHTGCSLLLKVVVKVFYKESTGNFIFSTSIGAEQGGAGAGITS
jgi:hypothetical protein